MNAKANGSLVHSSAPRSGEVKKWGFLTFPPLILNGKVDIIECSFDTYAKNRPHKVDLYTEIIPQKLHLEWSKKLTYPLNVKRGTVYTDGEIVVVAKRPPKGSLKWWDYVPPLWKLKIQDWNIIVINDDGNVTIVGRSKDLLCSLAKEYKEFLDDKSKEFLSSLTKTISLKLTETQYENFGDYSPLFIDKFRRMLSNVLKITWDPVKGFMVNGEPDSEVLSKCLKIVESHIGTSLDWEDMDYAIIADDTLIKISFFVSTSQPNVSLRITNKTTRVLKPEVIGDAVSAFYEAYKATLDEGREKGFGPDDEEFDNAFVEWLPTYLKLSSPNEWEVEYK